jgi:DNA-binding HxlR family transcriptional regulator
MYNGCKFDTVIEILVGKWKPIILFHLLSNGTMRFNELQKAMPDITKKMLTQQLRDLEYHGIVHREIYRQIPPKVEYSITEYGKGMTTLLEAMHEWGTAHVKHLKELYGEDRSLESLVSELDKVTGGS